MWTDGSEECITSIFNAESQPNRKPSCRHLLAWWFLAWPIFDPEDGDYMFLGNVGWHRDYTALCPRWWRRLIWDYDDWITKETFVAYVHWTLVESFEEQHQLHYPWDCRPAYSYYGNTYVDMWRSDLTNACWIELLLVTEHAVSLKICTRLLKLLCVIVQLPTTAYDCE
jgi:hypothetical protein